MISGNTEQMTQSHTQSILLHEIRNSISVMMLNLSIIAKSSSPDADERIEMIQRELSSLSRLLTMIMGNEDEIN